MYEHRPKPSAEDGVLSVEFEQEASGAPGKWGVGARPSLPLFRVPSRSLSCACSLFLSQSLTRSISHTRLLSLSLSISFSLSLSLTRLLSLNLVLSLSLSLSLFLSRVDTSMRGRQGVRCASLHSISRSRARARNLLYLARVSRSPRSLALSLSRYLPPPARAPP